MKYFSFILTGIIMLASCNSQPENQALEMHDTGMSKMANTDVAPVPGESQAVVENNLPSVPSGVNARDTAVTRKIIKDGRMEIRVKDLTEGRSQVDQLVKKFQAYYAEETFNNMDFTHGFSLKIRIPATQFEAFVAELENGIGELAFKNITSRDVTEEFIDLETRLKNKQNYLNRYGDLLKQARSVKDILEIEEKTRIIEEEIESVQGRLKYLNSQVDFSTLDLQISKRNDFNSISNNKGKFVDRLKMSLVKGWFGFVGFVLFLIRIWPFWIIVAVLYYIFKTIITKRRR